MSWRNNNSKKTRLLSKDVETPDGREAETKPLIETPSGDAADATKQKKDELPPVPFFRFLFRYAETFDVWLFVLGTGAAIANGASMPAVTLLFGNVIQTFVQYQSNEGITDAQLMKSAQEFFFYYLALGGFALTMGYFQFSSWMWLGERVTRKLRLDYFYSMMSQNVAWYDSHQTGDLTTRVVNDSQTVQEAVSEKTSQVFQQLSTFLAGFVIAFFKGWKMTLVLLSVFPILAISSAFMAKLFASLSTKGQAAYAEAGSVAEEVFSSIRTVVAFGGEKREVKRYKKKLKDAFNTGVSKGKVTGLGLGFTMFSLFCSYGLAFWFGGRQVLDGSMQAGDVLTVFFSVTVGAFALGGAATGLTAIASGSAAAARVFSVVDRTSPIDPFDNKGERPKIEGKIEFKNVAFVYPSRKDVPVLRDMSFTIPPGKTLALVGSSGCGKSTVISLLERFYDVDSGAISVDDHKIENINTRWLRSHIGLVSQEPALFAMSIRDNIALGKMDNGEEPTQAEIEAAAREANAHDFISQLPHGYDTVVGERGAQLSGGQKQRVAIARALLKKPKILLLDEATSALDSHSERVVQDALDKASKGRTTIVIAHRLTTVTNADYIAVVHEGKIAELGSHDELIANPESRYSFMVKAQAIVSQDEEIELRASSGGATSQFHLKSSTSHVSSDVKAGGISTEEEKEPEYPISFSRVASLNKKEWVYLMFGLFFATINGITMPFFSLIFSRVSTIFVEAYTDPEQFKSDSRMWSLMFVGLGVMCGIANFGQAYLFSYAGERLTQRLRKRSFQTMLKQPIGWFDQNTTGKLTTKLANDASLVQNMLGQRLASLVQAGVSMSAGLVLAFLGGWEMTVVVLGCVPLIASSGAFKVKALIGYSQQSRLAYEQAGTVATQAIENMRTVTSLAKERRFFELYEKALRTPFMVGVKRAQFAGLGFGVSLFFIFFTYGVAFYFGAYRMTKGMSFQDMMQVFAAVVFSAMAAGQAVSLAPDYSKAKDAASSVFRILDLESPIDSSSSSGQRPSSSSGKVQLDHVQFSYPTRPGVIVAKDLSINVPVGKTVALVGPSGCGKSTIVSLILRFYDVNAGTVLFDDANIRSLNIEWLRQQVGVVSQEPILFATTIKKNIAYGKKGKATTAEIHEVAAAANIHDFIRNLPEGYDTYVGEKGTQLSGGQKQRIAIARALIRNPKVLLLDEATSALDTESERVVQAALDNASVGRTTIIIAHRLSTIQRADSIAVVNDGKILEQGTHSELLEKGGLYAKLVKQQQMH